MRVLALKNDPKLTQSELQLSRLTSLSPQQILSLSAWLVLQGVDRDPAW